MKTRLLLSGFLICTTPAIADVTDDVRCQEIAFSRSVEMQDMSAFRSLIDNDARFVSGSVQRGVENVAAAWSVFFSDDGPRIKWRPQIVEVLADGTLALSRGPYQMITESPEGEVTEHWGTFNSVWRKQNDGSWKIVFDAGNESEEAPSDDVRAVLDREVDCT
jgi:ketosteroid isomerase-like protein